MSVKLNIYKIVNEQDIWRSSFIKTPVDQFTWEWMTAKIKGLDEHYNKLFSMAWDTKYKVTRLRDELHRHLDCVGEDDDDITMSDILS